MKAKKRCFLDFQARRKLLVVFYKIFIYKKREKNCCVIVLIGILQWHHGKVVKTLWTAVVENQKGNDSNVIHGTKITTEERSELNYKNIE